MANGSLGSIFVDLLLKTSNFDASLARSRTSLKAATSAWSQDLRAAGTNFKGVGSSLTTSINGITSSVKELAAASVAAFSVTEIVRYSDTWKQLQGRLAIVSDGFTSVADTQESLFQIAQQTRQPLDGIVNFYARLNQFVPEAERSQLDLLGVVKNVAEALAITGETSESATAAMIQFTQAIGSNFQSAGQELRSIQEQAPRLAKALQDALGGGKKSLQQLKDEGVLTRESVLGALSSMGEQGQILAAEFAKIPTTVGQAFTQLDNAFLKYIGQSQAINSGTNSIALAVTGLANNFNILADVSTALAVLYVARLAPAVVATVGSFVAFNVETIALQVSLARLEGISGTTAAALLALGVAGRAASVAISALGGPIGIALIGFYAAYQTEVNAAREGQEMFNDKIGEVKAGMDAFKTASNEVRQQIVSDTYDRIDALEDERKKLGEVLSQYNTGNGIGPAITDAFRLARDTAGSWVGLTESPQKAISAYKELGIQIDDTRAKLSGLVDQATGDKFVPAPDPAAMKKLQDLYEKNREYILGVTAAQIKYMDTSAELKKLLDAHKISTEQYNDALVRLKDDTDGVAKSQKKLDEIYDKHRDVIEGSKKALIEYQDTQADLQKLLEAGRISQDEYNDAVERAGEAYNKSLEAEKVWGYSSKELAKDASRDIHDSLADFLFDPFDKGLKGMLEGFADTLRRMAANVAASDILTGLFGPGGFGSSQGGGVLSGVVSSIGSAFSGYFADGGAIAPGQWGIVGEEGPEIAKGGTSGTTIIPMGGGMGGGIKVNIVNNAGAQISTTAKRGANGPELDVMVDQIIANKITTPGTASFTAMQQLNSRQLTKR